MSSSVGRLALGIVGGVVGSFFGMPGLGFALGSAVGGMLFAPEGPTVEGPRISDTAVTTSSLGKTIPRHWGTVRTGGNIIWSGGLREVKKKEKQRSGGKGGGGGSSQKVITYHYYASFAVALGHAPGGTLKRMWGDGKLIFDASRVNAYHKDVKFRFVKGGEGTPIDPLIASSIHRRMAGMADVNAGNQKQKKFKTAQVLIDELQADGSPRAQLYASLLAQRVSAANAAAGGGVPNYRFCPSYNELCYIVFDNLPLADFAGRIPNITCEVEFELDTPEGYSEVANVFPVETLSEGPAQGGLMALERDNQFLITLSNNNLRKFDANALAETAYRSGGGTLHSALASNAAREVLIFGQTVAGDPAFYIYNTASLTRTTAITGGGWSFLNTGVTPNSRMFAKRFPRRMYDAQNPQLSVADAFMVATDDRASLVSATVDVGNLNTSLTDDNESSSGKGWLFDAIFKNLAEKKKDASRPAVETSKHVLDTLYFDTGGATPKAGPMSPQFNVGEYPNIVLTRFGNTHVSVYRVIMKITRTELIYVDGNGNEYTKYESAGSGSPLFGMIWRGDLYVDENGNLKSLDSDSLSQSTRQYTKDSLSVGKIATHNFAPHLNGATIEDVSMIYYDWSEDEEKASNLSSGNLLAFLGPGGADRYRDETSGGGLPDIEGGRYALVLRLSNGTGLLYNSSTGAVRTIPQPPRARSGFCNSYTRNSDIAYTTGDEVHSLNLWSGASRTFEGLFEVGADADNQVYVATIGSFLTWDGDTPVIVRIGSPNAGLGGSRSVSGIISNLCSYVGMREDEYDVTPVLDKMIRGLTVGRPSSARQVIQILLDAHALDSVEKDWTVVFQRKTSDVTRTISEDELGDVGSDGEQSNFITTRTPEYDLPREIQITYVDSERDYGTNTAQTRRSANPISTMDSTKIENMEMPLVLKPHEAKALTDAAMFQKWMQRDASQFSLPWTHMDLDPADVVSIEFRDGTVMTDRIQRMTVGANFEIQFDSVRHSDPVYVPREIPQINAAAVPQTILPVVVPSDMFVFDIPAIADFQATIATTGLYAAVGAQSPEWQAATIYRSEDGGSYGVVASTGVDIVWGVISGRLDAPRSYWTTDRENTLTIYPMNDEDEINSITYEELIAGGNMALVWNRTRQDGEIIAFQTADLQPDGSIILSGLLRGLRGTEYFCDMHAENEEFFLLDQTRLQKVDLDLSSLNTPTYWKAVSTGQIIGEAAPVAIRSVGRDVAPWAPSRARREPVEGGIKITWNRRSRIGGQWNTSATVEANPTVEDRIIYRLWIVMDDNEAVRGFNPDLTSTYLYFAETQDEEHTITDAQLAEMGLTPQNNLRIILQQVGGYAEGFMGRHVLVP